MHTAHVQKSPLAAKPTVSTAKPKVADRKEEIITIIGRIASVFSVIMYVSYITQISNNLAGNPGSPWQPLAAVFNCVLWATYGFFKKERDWPIVIANVPGIFFALGAFITSFIH